MFSPHIMILISVHIVLEMCMLCSSPATCRGCTGVCWLCCRCTALDNSLLHRTVHMCLGLPPSVQDPQCAKPEPKREQTFVCCGKVTMTNVWVLYQTWTCPEASSTIRSWAASFGWAWSSMTSNFTCSTLAATTGVYNNHSPHWHNNIWCIY